jgi:hypothetical protein
VTSTGFNVPYSYLYRKYINHIHPPLPCSFTLPLPLELFPSHDLFYIIVLQCFKSLFVVQWEFCLDILPVNILYLNQPNPFHTLSCPFTSTLDCAAVFSVIHCVLFLHTEVMYFIIIHCYSFLLFLFPLTVPLWKYVLYIYVYIW